MADFKLAGIVSAVGFGLGYLLSGRSSQVMEAVQGEYGITYMESHNEAENQHKYYLLLTSGKDNYTAYGRLPGYGREATMKLDKQPSASKMKELAMKKMKTYQLVGHKYDQIPSEIRAKLETEIGVKPSSPPAESQPKQEEPKKPMNPYLAMAMKRRQMMGAEYQPDQEIGDYSVSEIAKSSAIEGYQPNKYSFGPIGYGAEMKLKKDSCCCGATKKHPCLCMIKGTKQCSAKSPMCPCYKEIAMGTKVEMEHTTSKEEAEKIAKEHLAEHPDYYSRLKSAGLDAETFKAENEQWCNTCGSFGYDPDLEKGFCDYCICVGCNERAEYAKGSGYCKSCYEETFPHRKIEEIYERYAESYEADERWYGLELKHKGKLHRSMTWTYEDIDGTQIEIYGDGGAIKKEGITLDEASEYLNQKGIPFDPLESVLYHYNDETVNFSHPKGECYKHDWSEIIFDDYSYDDDETGGIVFEQRCRYCDIKRKGNLRGKVSWDMNAETIIPRDFVCSVCDSSNLKIDVEQNEVFCDDCGLVNEDLMQTVKRKPIQLSDRSKYGCWGFRVPIMDDPDFVKIDWEMKAETIIPRDFVCSECNSSNLEIDRNEVICEDCGVVNEDLMQTVKRKPNPKPVNGRRGFPLPRMDAESSDSIPKANPADKEETFAWVKREHPHIKTEADKEMDEYNYAALTYHPEELESGAVNALKAGDLEAAQNFVKAINRQKFIKAFQAERNR